MLLLIVTNYQWVTLSTYSEGTDQVSEINAKRYALLLGTSPRNVEGERNAFFEARMDATAELYKAGKVSRILVSGTMDGRYYDETSFMRQALIKRGIPKPAIRVDALGVRTLDSIIRAKKVYQIEQFIIVSQAFHNHRALYIAQHHGLDATAYHAEKASGLPRIHMILREHLARVLMMLDLYVMNTQPRSLEKKPV